MSKITIRKPTPAEISDIEAVIQDGRRIDRYLRLSDEGNYFTTPDYEFIGPEGPYCPPSVRIPVGERGEPARRWARALCARLRKEIAAS